MGATILLSDADGVTPLTNEAGTDWLTLDGEVITPSGHAPKGNPLARLAFGYDIPEPEDEGYLVGVI